MTLADDLAHTHLLHIVSRSLAANTKTLHRHVAFISHAEHYILIFNHQPLILKRMSENNLGLLRHLIIAAFSWIDTLGWAE